jgi:hypothetical protein
MSQKDKNCYSYNNWKWKQQNYANQIALPIGNIKPPEPRIYTPKELSELKEEIFQEYLLSLQPNIKKSGT